MNGTVLHYVRGGSGPAVILLHGFPQDWYEYHQVMPRLAQRFTVVAVDLRRIGGSTATAGGYEAANLAEDIRQLSQQLQLERPYLVGHDMGAMVAYAFARRFPDAARGVMLLDVPLPGIEPWDKVVADPLPRAALGELKTGAEKAWGELKAAFDSAITKFRGPS